MAVTSAKSVSSSQSESVANTPALESIDLLESLTSLENDFPEVESGNVALAPDEVATLRSLMERYDEVLIEIDRLSLEIESMLKIESAKLVAPDSTETSPTN